MASTSQRPAPVRDVRTALGPAALEALLLDDLEREITAVRADPRLLARPLAILVPSHSLRVHLAAGAVRRLQSPLAGVAFDTLHGYAAALLERAGEPVPRGASLFAACVRRHARAERGLSGEFAHLDEGWRSIVGTLGDLFDGGFEAAHEPALLDALGATGAPGRAEERARALARVAGAVARDLAGLGLGRSTAIYKRAALALERDPELGRARAVWIHGFADATAAVIDFLAALHRTAGARIYFDAALALEPRGRPDRRYGQRYGARFQERLAPAVRTVSPIQAAAGSQASRARAFRAPGREAEVREVAVRIARLLEPGLAAGVEPERIGVVARDLEPYRLAIRLHFRRLAIPFSALSTAGASGPAERQARALAELLRRGAELPVERWLDARAPHAPAADVACDVATADGTPARSTLPRARDFDLLLALRALGAVRLREVIDLDLPAVLGGREVYPLPVRSGSSSATEDEPVAIAAEGAPPRSAGRVRRRSVSGRELERARQEVSELCARLEAAPARASLRSHTEWLRGLVREELHWRAGSLGTVALEAALAFLESDLPPSTPLAADEFTSIFETALSEHGRTPLGGRGGGVACLSVAEARGRTFEHLFVLGLNQGVFPRRVREDPLLPDELRRRVTTLLPDLALRSFSHEEERCLFEQLLRASADVTLSWQTVDEDGRALAPSPFVERLFAGGADAVDLAPPVLPRVQAREREPLRADPRPAHEQAILTALHGTREEFVRILPAALQEGLELAGLRCTEVGALAAVRGRILDELDPPPARRSHRSHLGPYYGFLGGIAHPDDLRQSDVFVTTLERMADCPWQTFLTRLLRIELAPDPLDTLPSVDARMLGNLVHVVLQRIARGALGAEGIGGADPAVDLDTLRAAAPRPLVWPTPERVDALAHAVAREILRDEGIVLLGLARVLVEQARPLFEVARRTDAQEGGETAGCLGTEVWGALPASGGAPERRLRFVVDRVDRIAGSDGGLRLTDYKTGAPISDKKRSETRERDFLRRVESGRSLQGVAYASAAGVGSQGRYLFLKPEIPEDARRFAVEGDDAALRAAFERATATLFRAWRSGVFLPRLVDASLAREHHGCPSCEVSQACLRGDSGARARLVRWVRAREGEPDERDREPETAAWQLWSLAQSGEVKAQADPAEVTP